MAFAGYIFDMDGTLFRGDEVIAGAPETLAELRHRDAKVWFLTNNSSQTRASFVAKLNRMGFAATSEEIYSTAVGAAAYLNEQGLKRAFVVGESGLITTLHEAGISITDESGVADAVVAGICRTFDYEMLNVAMQFLRRGAQFVATNRDATYPMAGGRFVPGSGSIVAAVETAGGVTPHVIGKPNPDLIHQILALSELNAADVLVVGDRLDTDIESGIRAGCPTHLVLTGVESAAPPGQPWSADVSGLLA